MEKHRYFLNVWKVLMRIVITRPTQREINVDSRF